MSFHVFKAETAREAPGPGQAERRRRRRTVSCMPCRQLKVSCDRKTPCSRCVWGQRAAECTYCEFPRRASGAEGEKRGPDAVRRSAVVSTCRLRVQHAASSGSVSRHASASNPKAATNRTAQASSNTAAPTEIPWYTPKSALRGVTHWDNMLHQFQSILPDNEESRVLLDGYLAQKPERYESVDCTTPSPNFPFAGMESSATVSRAEILARIPSQAVSESLVRQYLCTIEGTHRLFHIPSFEEELATFWDDPMAVSYEWLAQLFMVLALGYQATSTETQCRLSEDGESSLAQVFLQSTESCLKKTPFMFKPNTTMIRVLCLIVVAKLAGGYSCSEIDSCGTLTDMAVRGCMELGIHRPGCNGDRASFVDKQKCARLWTTAVFLKVQQAMNSGTPLLLRPTDFDASVVENINDDELGPNMSSAVASRPHHQYTSSTCHILVAKALPIAIDVVSCANSPDGECTPSQMSDHGTNIRKLLHDVQELYDLEPLDDRFGWRHLQKPMLEIWLRRTLLIIHQLNTPGPMARVSDRGSLWSYLGCALAILVNQRQMLEAMECPVMAMLAGLFKQDFFIAAVGACAVLRDDDGACTQSEGDWPPGMSRASTRETILEALRWCKELWEKDMYQSECSFWAHLILERLTEAL